MTKTPNPPRRGHLFGDDWTGQRCGARCKSTGKPCRAPAYTRNGKCRVHGGPSSGPKSGAGRAKAAAARWKHGRYSQITSYGIGRAVRRMIRSRKP